MRKTIFALSLLLCSCFSPSSKTEGQSIEVNFSPNGGAADAIVREIDSAKKSVFVMAYSFTNQKIKVALFSAFDRGVNIEIILDKENLKNKSSLLFPLHEKGIKIFIDDKHPIAHNKIMLIDNNVLVTGSMNYSKAGDESNAENSLIIKNNPVMQRYIINWELHKSHSPRYDP